MINLLKKNEFSTQKISNILKRNNSTIKEHLISLENKSKVTKRTEYFNMWGVCNKSRYKRHMWRLA